MLFFGVLLIYSVFLLSNGLESSDGPVVKLPQGLVQGTYKKSYKNRTYAAFEGIPYAVPPVGSLRFMEPKPAAEWDGTLLANTHYECLHFMPFPVLYGARGTEDCLYTYIYTPRERIDPNELLDVIVHIHGGGFMLGAPKYMAGPDFLIDRDIIVVSLNYRLGILGFLSTEDQVVPGNNGLKDQSLALKWIKNNIKYFGGNPASVTITGMSAGAASVHFHYFSPLSKGLFHRGFSQSGTALQCWALAENPLEKARAVAQNLTCPTSSTEEMVNCLQKVDGPKLVLAIKTILVYMDAIPFSPFAPVVEPNSNLAFLSEHPYEMLRKGKVHDVPWITSNTREEGLFPVGLIAGFNKLKEFDDKWYDIMQYALELHYTVDPTLHREVLSKIKEHYFKGQPITKKNVYSFVDVFTDRMFLIDAENAIRMQAQATKSEVYYYVFSYVAAFPHFPPNSPKGAVHGDDGRLMFRMFLTPEKLSVNDERMMDFFLDLITTFARKGVPSMNNNIEWPPLTPGASNINLLYIADPNNITIKSPLSLTPNDFWKNLPIKEGANATVAGASSKNQSNYYCVTITTLLTIISYVMQNI